MSTLERAIAIAAEAHAGHFDKAGAPYVLHPLRMMLRVSSIDERIVAVLHDVVEDCRDGRLIDSAAKVFPITLLKPCSR
jgi:(p)ppGpp synthase/HD superfamily hydrolase